MSEKPSAWSTARVPTSATGITATVIAVVVGECRKRRFTKTTSAQAMARVMLTSRSATSTKVVKSTATEMSTPSGTACWIPGRASRTARETASSFDLDWRTIPTPTVSRALKRVMAW